ncbi:amino acid ABC transporter permease [Microvirga sp. VF16]|uniref:amino acid ABC transporter permease n=1 Tax=Microvirga sp. VF16 TaxID=2807101 RepID=UPI00193DEACD|nr:amino acid ABC transporter permease [Microvirga sp. VF16]QRM32882.1 amino acid ABC transporter permease [Microvirga sp. VF16]
MTTDVFLSPDLWLGMLRGVQITIAITILSTVFGLIGGIVIALMNHFGGSAARWFARTYVFFFRGVPLLILLYFLYFGVPQISLLRSGPLWTYVFSSPFATCVLAFSLNNAAYLAEVVRGGIRAIKPGEIEAGHALGLSGRKVLQRIVLPLGLRNCLSGIANEVIFTIKASAVASIITVRDLFSEAQRIGTVYSDNLTPLIAAGIFYVVLVQIVEWGARFLRSYMHGVSKSGASDPKSVSNLQISPVPENPKLTEL